MEDVLNNFNSLSWWVTVIVFGSIASIIGAYLKPILDKSLGKAITSVRISNDRKASLRKEKIDALSKNINKQILYALEINRLRLQSLNFVLAGTICLVTANFVNHNSNMFILLGVLSLSGIISGMYLVIEAQRNTDILDESKKLNE